jgi:acetoacetyl-CoA synthetase
VIRKLLWKPSEPQIQATNLTHFIEEVRAHLDPNIHAYEDLYQWSLQNPQAFWKLIWEFGGVIGTQGKEILTNSQSVQKAEFFPDSTLNFAQNLLRKKTEDTAIVYWCEGDIRRSLTYNTLYNQVSLVAQALKDRGLKPGDRVAAVMPNMPETIICMLAVTSIGGVWSSCSPDFGVTGVLDRFSQIDPKFLIVCDSYIYRAQTIDCQEKTQGIQEGLPSLDLTIVVPFQGKRTSLSLQKAMFLPDLVSPYTPKAIDFAQLPFNHPLYIMFSSGTTGIPKCIVHGAGGTLLQHLKEHRLHSDIKPNDRVFYFSTCGWMMWNWLVSALASEATLLLYEGSPLHPTRDILFEYAQEEKMTFMGVSAKYIDALKKFKLAPKKTHNLENLRVIASTGGPLVEESFHYIYDYVKEDVCLASISGGTDIVSCFVLGNPIAPVWAGEIQTRGLGMNVDVFDEEGHSIRQQKGELVCKSPFPSRPLGFWGDPDGKKYYEAYFSRYPNIWCHGDFAEITDHQGMVIYGRSDAVLNPGGVRIGTAEIYRQVEQIEEVVESLAIGQDWKGDIRVILFVVLKEDVILDADLNALIKQRIRDNTTPRHVPSKIIQVRDLPKTKSGKLVELAVREIIHNRPVRNQEALANPEALKQFENLPDLYVA